MGATAISTDRLIFTELQFLLGSVKHFAWFQDARSIAAQVAAGATNAGPRWALWSETAAGRFPLYRYVRTADTTRGLVDHAFQTTADWSASGYTLDNGGAPIGYATSVAEAGVDCLPVLQCSGAAQRFAYTQWAYELSLYESQCGMTAQPTAWAAPMMAIVEARYDASTSKLQLTSNDRDAARAARGEVNTYRGNGTPILFANMGVGEYPAANALAVTYEDGPDQGQSAIGAGQPFELVTASEPSMLWLIADNQQVDQDQKFEYTVTLLVEGQTVTHDPKIIQRKKQVVD